jgi:hypothetical protein
MVVVYMTTGQKWLGIIAVVIIYVLAFAGYALLGPRGFP